MLMDKEHGRRWSGMFAILITSIVLKGYYLLLLGLSDKESVTVSAVSLVNTSRKQREREIKIVYLHLLNRIFLNFFLLEIFFQNSRPWISLR